MWFWPQIIYQFFYKSYFSLSHYLTSYQVKKSFVRSDVNFFAYWLGRSYVYNIPECSPFLAVCMIVFERLKPSSDENGLQTLKIFHCALIDQERLMIRNAVWSKTFMLNMINGPKRFCLIKLTSQKDLCLLI